MSPRETRSESRIHPDRPWLELKVIQPTKSQSHIGQRRGNRGLVGIGIMCLAVHHIAMHLYAQCRFHLLCRPAERDHVPAGRHTLDAKARALEPSRNLIDVTLAPPKAAAELFRRKP